MQHPSRIAQLSSGMLLPTVVEAAKFMRRGSTLLPGRRSKVLHTSARQQQTEWEEQAKQTFHRRIV